MKSTILFLLVLCGGAWAQSKPSDPTTSPKVTVDGKPVPAAAPAAPVVPPAVTMSEEVSYPLPLADRDKIRDLQHEYDQLEIDSQQMQVKIEKNKARQSTLVDAMKLGAFQFSQAQKIDLDLYEFDPAQIRFVKKKAKQ